LKTPAQSLLRWYPEPWRARYGPELVALIEDDLCGRQPSLRFRISIAVSGLRERSHQVGLTGQSAPASERSRTGALLVLCAWTAFVIAGISFGKLAEYFQTAVSDQAKAISTTAYDTIFVLAIFAGALVVAGAVFALPAFFRFCRSGGWPAVRGHFRRSLAASVLALGALLAVRWFAHSLDAVQRNGGDAAYSAAYLACAFVVVAAMWLWTAAVVAVVRRLELPVNVQRTEAVLAVVVASAILLMTVATAVWWGAVDSGASWFLSGSRPGAGTSLFDPNMLVTMSLMLVAIALAGYGVTRISLSWKDLGTAPLVQ
jgi:hypothetical protein